MISINDLPSEILVHIFSFCIKLQGYRQFLRNIPLVCKRWNEVYSIPSLWKNFSTPYVSDSSDEDDSYETENEWSWKEMKKLGKKGLLSSARYLNLSECPYKENEMTEFIRYFHNLRMLKVIETFMPRAALEVLADQCPNIRCLDLFLSDQQIEDFFTPFLRVRGQNIKDLNITIRFPPREKDWVSTIAKSCFSLESVSFSEHHYLILSSPTQFPIFDLITGCPKLREFDIFGYKFASEIRDHNGFSDIVSFVASYTDFGGVDLYSILKNAKNLESVYITVCHNVTWGRISKIPSEKMIRFSIEDHNSDAYTLEFLREAVTRWKHTLTSLRIKTPHPDLTGVLEAYLHENLEPKLIRLFVSERSDLGTQLLEHLTGACKNLQVFRF